MGISISFRGFYTNKYDSLHLPVAKCNYITKVAMFINWVIRKIFRSKIDS